MPTYQVIWKTIIDAHTPEAAAQKARKVQLSQTSVPFSVETVAEQRTVVLETTEVTSEFQIWKEEFELLQERQCRLHFRGFSVVGKMIWEEEDYPALDQVFPKTLKYDADGPSHSTNSFFRDAFEKEVASDDHRLLEFCSNEVGLCPEYQEYRDGIRKWCNECPSEYFDDIVEGVM